MQLDRKKSLTMLLFSTAGIILMALILIILNVISGAVNTRLDFTQEKIFTLSPGTAAILKKVDTPVQIRFYYTKDSAQMPVFLKTYASRVEDLLKQYRVFSDGKVAIKTFDPSPDSDAEDSANLDGVTGQNLTAGGDPIYLGLAVNCLDQIVTLPFLSPDRENLLEYDITRAIYRVMNPEKPVIGVMSSLPVMGSGPQQNMMMPGMQNRNEPPWVLVDELKRDFTLREVPVEAEEIGAEIHVLLLIHPKNLSDKTLFALDQFVLRGGRIAAFLDPLCWVDNKSNSMGGMMPPAASTLGKLLDAWGVQFDTEKVVADLVGMTQIQGRNGSPERMPSLITLTKDSVDRKDPATAQLDNLIYAFGGAFTGDGATGLKKTVLASSSEDSEMAEKFMAQMGGEQIIKSFKSDGRKKALAIRLSGQFKTAFPDGKPIEEKTEENKGPEKKDEAKAGDALKESAKDSVVVLIGDADMLYDQFCVRVQNVFGQKFMTPLNDNLNFVQNLMEQLSGDQNLISIRGRGTTNRPFLVVTRMQAEAEQRFQDQIRLLEEKASEAQRKITELQREKSKDQKYILSPEQKAEITKLKQTEAESRKELKTVRKQLRRDIDRLETKVKWANIALMPVLVGFSGIMIAIIRKRRMKQG